MRHFKNEFPCMGAITFRMNHTRICLVNHMPTLGWVALWDKVGVKPPPKPVRARGDPSETQWLNSIYTNIEALTRKKVATLHETFQKMNFHAWRPQHSEWITEGSVQLTICQLWVGWRHGAKRAPDHHPNQWEPSGQIPVKFSDSTAFTQT